jgi:hypothetical protein
VVLGATISLLENYCYCFYLLGRRARETVYKLMVALELHVPGMWRSCLRVGVRATSIQAILSV